MLCSHSIKLLRIDTAILLCKTHAHKAGHSTRSIGCRCLHSIGLCTSETHNELDGGKIMINNFYKNSIKLRTIRTNPNKTKDTYEYTCDAQGKILSHVLTLSDGTVEEAVYNYDEATGLLVSIMTSNSSNTFAYNAHGDLSNEVLTVNGTEVYKANYTYNYTYYAIG